MAMFIFTQFQYKLMLFVYIFVLKTIGISHAYLKVWSPLSSVIEADVQSRLTLPCNISGDPRPRISWLKDGRRLAFDSERNDPYEGLKGLLFHSVVASDSGNYTCLGSNLYDLKEVNMRLSVKTPPAKLTNVTVHPSTVVATVRWHVENDGGYSITNFTLLYRPAVSNDSEVWLMPQPVHISPSVRQFFIYQLKPGTDYLFKIWASNKLGPGEAVTIKASTSNPIDPPEAFRKILVEAESFGSTAWLLAISMMIVTVLSLSLLGFALIYRTKYSGSPEDEIVPRIITNPGFEIDLEQCYLLEDADYNDNTEKPIRINNNTVILPSRV